MRTLSTLSLGLLLATATLSADVRQARELELNGALREAEREYKAAGGMAYAEFLERRHQPGAREAYEKLLTGTEAGVRRQALKRLVVLNLMAGDKAKATQFLNDYRTAGGTELAFDATPRPPVSTGETAIPGPIRSFSRMAALSPDLAPEEILGALARNIVTNGYQAAGNNEGLDQTEYLKLVYRYLSQAKELENRAVRFGEDGRVAEGVGLPDARGVRWGPGAGNGERDAGVSDD